MNLKFDVFSHKAIYLEKIRKVKASVDVSFFQLNTEDYYRLHR